MIKNSTGEYRQHRDEAYWTPPPTELSPLDFHFTEPQDAPTLGIEAEAKSANRGAFRSGFDPRRHRHVKSTGKCSRTIYLLHFSEPFKHARHYLGSAHNLEMRLNAHNNGGGARLTQVARNAGITFELVRTWAGDRREERRLKVMGGGARLCPKCRATRQEVAHV